MLGAAFRPDHRVLLPAIAPAVLWLTLLFTADQTFWSFVFDDSFYYWQIGRNLAAGAGSTFDGLNQTNGYHPLWLLFCAGLYALGLGADAPLVAVGVQVVVFAVAWLLLGRSLVAVTEPPDGPSPRAAGWGVVATLLVVAVLHSMVKVWVNGLESAFVLLCQVLLLGVLLRVPDLLAPSAARVRLACAALVSLAFLARTDGGLLLPALGLWLAPALWRGFRGAVRPALELLLLPTLVVLGFLAANQAWFGSAVQVSGLLKSPSLSLWRVGSAVLVVIVPILLSTRLDARRWPRLAGGVRSTRPFGLFVLLVTAYYGFLQVFPRPWYFGPVLLYVVALGALAVADVVVMIAAQRPTGDPRRGLVAGGAGLAALLLVPVVLGVQQALTAPAAAPLLAGRAAAEHIAAELPADAILASWDAGVIGYYSERPVVNLDGVVNSSGYLEALRAGTTAEHLAGVPIGWVVNHSPDEQSLRVAATRVIGPRARDAEVVATWPFDVFGGMNQLLPESHHLTVFLLQLRPQP